MTNYVTLKEFSNQFPRLILNARDLPRKPVAFNIFLISVVCGLDPERGYSEPELNEALQLWILTFGSNLGLDHANIRRFLIDGGYLGRNPAGTQYTVNLQGRRFAFDPSILELDLRAMVDAEADRRDERKRRFTGGV